MALIPESAINYACSMRGLSTGPSYTRHTSRTPNLMADSIRARQNAPKPILSETYEEPVRRVAAQLPSEDGSSHVLHSRSLKVAALNHLMGPSKATVKEDRHSDAVMELASALISRTVHGTLPNDRTSRNAVLREDAEFGVSVRDEQRTKAYRSQDYAKKFPGVDTLANHDLLRDASKRLAGSKTSVDIYRSMTPGQAGKTFAQLCRDIATNQYGYTPKAGDEKGFVNIHKGYCFDPLDNDDAIYSGRQIYLRGKNRYGYDNDSSDVAAEYLANRKGRNPKVATGERDSIYGEELEEAWDEAFEEELQELLNGAGDYAYNAAREDGYDEDDALEIAAEQMERFLDTYEDHWSDDELEDIASIEEMTKSQAKAHAGEMADHFWDTMLTHEYEPKPGSKRYGVISLSVYNSLDNKYRYNLCSIHRPLKEGQDLEFNGRTRQHLPKAERGSLDRSGSLSYKLAGPKLTKNSDSVTVKDSEDERADRENPMMGLTTQSGLRLKDAIRAHLNRPMGKSFTDDKMWTAHQFRYRG
jgi:hypothetical protein